VKKLKISYKMTLWYTSLTLALLLVFMPILYASISASFYSNEKDRLLAASAEVISGLDIENHIVSLKDASKIDNSFATVVWSNNKVLFHNSNMPWLFIQPFEEGKINKINYNDETWLIYDNVLNDSSKQVIHIRVASSFDASEDALAMIRLLILLSIPAYLIAIILGGLFISKKSLKPIHKISQTAKMIGNGDLTKRINGIESNDEVSELADTFNEMLGKLEYSFKREKRFAADASHELRTPVAVLIAYCESLLEESQKGMLDKRFEQQLKNMLDESKRMNTIISQLLMLTRGQEGKYKLELETINMYEVIYAVIQQMSELAEKSNISLIYEGPKNIPLTADQRLMTQMVLNLVENAIKYGKINGQVIVAAENIGDSLLITVSDNGIGISPENIPHIFERFYRVDESRDRSGTGLGLSIVSWIVKEHKGEINVTSELGKGTTFYIKL
jgi:signal transduction histidine kinase